MKNLLNNIRIVLVNTSHPGNIGSTARAMKTMGLSQLYLVAPQDYPNAKATALAAGADDILAQAQCVAEVVTAVQDCHLLIGTSARDRALPWPLINPHQCAAELIKEPVSSQIAILFGCETSGLSNTDLQRCHYHVQIPTNPDYCSLNLAQAVQLICYEIRMAVLAAKKSAPKHLPATTMVSNAEMERYYQHLEKVLYAIQFIKPNTPNRIMPRLRRLYHRARPNKVEINILRGILSEMERAIDKLC